MPNRSHRNNEILREKNELNIVKSKIDHICNITKVPFPVAVHALFIFSGDEKLALTYLKNNDSNNTKKPWKPKEDFFLEQLKNGEGTIREYSSIIVEKGEQNVDERLHYIRNM
eukprot:gb/GECH01000522.1/.p1 GENE.gb/GECH01000522.1/~~gb/GECH01000522.1/.p1  ORF type:complete len:113 (+),score=21.72 gb/GECH01000522.1/:1-339(+)